MTRRQRLAAICFGVIAAIAVALICGEVTKAILLSRLEARAAEGVRLREALLASEIARFRLLPSALADDRDLAAMIVDGSAEAKRRLNEKLERLARSSGASAIYVVDPRGLAVSASNWQRPDTFVGHNYAFRPYFQQALAKGTAQQFALGSASHKPGLYLATRGAGGAVVVVKLEFDELERQWSAADGVTIVTDRLGVVLVTSREAWRFAQTRQLAEPERSAEINLLGVRALGQQPYVRSNAVTVLARDTGDRHVLAQGRPDASGWRVSLLLPLKEELASSVRLAQGLGLLIALLAMAMAYALIERARQRRIRTSQLQAAVEERTIELRREIQERAAAEDRAAAMREDLRQANRLATLGQVTASVAHETAQPLAAIRNYAVTAAMLADRGDMSGLRDNLATIERLVDRIGKVTTHLRGFARKGPRTGVGNVVLKDAIEGACLILKAALARVTFRLTLCEEGLTVHAEQIRLEQVLVILLQNALEALSGTHDPQIALTVSRIVDSEGCAAVEVTVADNGPGVSPAIVERLFTPFASDRPAGLGLGLVIAKDIMEEFGGTLELRPSATGACFALKLPSTT